MLTPVLITLFLFGVSLLVYPNATLYKRMKDQDISFEEFSKNEFKVMLSVFSVQELRMIPKISVTGCLCIVTSLYGFVV